MTSPITRYHVINGALQRYTRIPPAFPDPGDTSTGTGSGVGQITLGGTGSASGTVTTIFGYNWNDKDNPEQTIAGRKAKFNNRVPLVRTYGGALDGTFSVSINTAQEKRVADSFKAGGAYTAHDLATSSAALTAMKNYLRSIPQNWHVFWIYHHEPNSSGGLEVPAADFLGTYDQMMAAKAAVIADGTLAAGVQVDVTACFMAYQVGTTNWDDNWVPNCDILTWDMYGNPGQNTSASGTNKYGTATAGGYGATYPLVAARTAAMFAVTQSKGFAASWGIVEFNAPQRNWDLNEVGRKQWHQDYIDYFMAGGGMAGGKPPKLFMLWEAPSGANWNQSYGYNWDPTPTKSPVPGTVAFNQTKVTNSPIWDVWYPYITGTPVGG